MSIDAYVERRRVIGRTHARIELGLLIYLLAMEFVSAWLRRAIEDDERLRARATAALSVRRLIAFDSAVVVDTYGARTAQSLEEHRARLQHVAGVMRAVTEGDLDRHIDLAGPSDILGMSLNDMVRSLREVAREMELIAGGDYSAQPSPRSEKDQLGNSLQAMTRALREAAERNERQMWIAETQTALGQAMSGNPSLRELSQRVLSLLCRRSTRRSACNMCGEWRRDAAPRRLLCGRRRRARALASSARGWSARPRWRSGASS